jgi:hypothetical protein
MKMKTAIHYALFRLGVIGRNAFRWLTFRKPEIVCMYGPGVDRSKVGNLAQEIADTMPNRLLKLDVEPVDDVPDGTMIITTTSGKQMHFTVSK